MFARCGVHIYLSEVFSIQHFIMFYNFLLQMNKMFAFKMKKPCKIIILFAHFCALHFHFHTISKDYVWKMLENSSNRYSWDNSASPKRWGFRQWVNFLDFLTFGFSYDRDILKHVFVHPEPTINLKFLNSKNMCS